MSDLWRAKVVENGNVHLEQCASLAEGKQWALMKLAERGHAIPSIEWTDRERSSVAVPGPRLELHVTRMD